MTLGFVAKRAVPRASVVTSGARARVRSFGVCGGLLSFGLWVAACTGSSHRSGGPAENGDEGEQEVRASAQALTYYRDAKPIIDQKCGLCHYDGGIGPFPFTTFDEIKPYINLIKADIEDDIMPPWRAVGDYGVFEGDRRLTDEQKETLLAWIDQGASKGNRADEPEALAPEQRGLPRVDESLALPEPYTPDNESGDTYRCFLYEWPHEQRKFITGMSVEPTRADMVHHGVVYLVAPEAAASMRARDDAAPGPGFDCYNAANLGSWLTSYEPGGYGQTFGGGIGMQVEPGSMILLQVHYNTLKAKGEDNTRLDLVLEDSVERVGRTTLILNPLWAIPGFGTMLIPANNPDVRHYWAGVPAALQGGPQEIYAADLHMHTLAISGTIGLLRAGSGESVTLLDIPRWAFEWQETFRFIDPVRLNPGDQLWVECHFDNTAEKQLVIDGKRLQPRDVRWGENTTDEMCLGNVLTTPAL